MHEFTHWHAHFDSILLIFPLQNVPPTLLRELKIHSNSTSWEQFHKLPQLLQVYQQFQRFFGDDENWQYCNLNQVEKISIQHALNNLLAYVECEKRYAKQHWAKDDRRVQASVVHFYVFFVNFIEAITPKKFQNLIQSKKQEMLVCKLQSLQILINQILKLMPNIEKFMLKAEFQEESHLTQVFLANFIQLIKKLPIIKRSAYKQIPKLLEYINLHNTIEIQKLKLNESSGSSRKNQKYEDQNKKINESGLNQESEGYHHNTFNAQFNFFKLKSSPNQRKHSVFLNAKKATITTMTEIKDFSIGSKERTISQDVFLTEDQKQIKGKSLTITNSPTKVPKNKTRETIHEKRKDSSPNTPMTPRSNHSKSNEKRTLKKTIVQTAQDQYERDSKVKKAANKCKFIIEHITMAKIPTKINLESGKLRGWDVIRQYVQLKIAKRKMLKLLSQ